MKKANKIFHDFLSLIYPDKCPICKRIIYEGGGVCKECDVKFKAETYLPAPDCSRENRKCDCRPETDFDKTIYKYIHLSQYNLSKDDPVGKGLVLYCKEHNVKAVYDYLGMELAKLCRERIIIREDDLITYIPRHPSVKKRTGVDQSFYLALSLSEALGLEMVHALKHVGGKTQKNLRLGERALNAANSFTGGKDIQRVDGRRVLIVDDIVTTGSTMVACANLLLSNNASNVVAVSVCRTYMEE